MPPLFVEMRPKGSNTWIKMPTLGPNDRPGSLSDNKPKRRDIYIFGCSPDDTFSRILRPKAGVDVEVGGIRAFSSTEPFDFVEMLRKGDSYELEIKSPSGKEVTFRFKHI